MAPVPPARPPRAYDSPLRVRRMESGSSGTGARGPVAPSGQAGSGATEVTQVGQAGILTVRGSTPQPERLC